MSAEKEKGVKGNGGFIRAEEENQTEEESRNKSWRSNTQNIKKTDSQENMRVTNRTEPIVNYQEE